MLSHVGEISLYFVLTEHVKFVDSLGYLRDLVIKPLLLVFFAVLVAAAVARMQRPSIASGASAATRFARRNA